PASRRLSARRPELAGRRAHPPRMRSPVVPRPTMEQPSTVGGRRTFGSPQTPAGPSGTGLHIEENTTMTETSPTRSGPVSSSSYATTGSNDVTCWAGWVVFAGIMLIMLGAFQVIEGLVALF